VLYLIIDIPDSMTYFKTSEVTLNFITDAIFKISKDTKDNQGLVEDSLVLLITQKMLKRDSEYTCSQLATESSLLQLMQIAKQKKNLSKHIEYILFLISTNTQYQSNTYEILLNRGRNKHDLDKYKSSERSEIFNQMWRPKPSSSSHAKQYYEFNDVDKIDTQLQQERSIFHIRLPIISSQAVDKYTKELPDDNWLRGFKGEIDPNVGVSQSMQSITEAPTETMPDEESVDHEVDHEHEQDKETTEEETSINAGKNEVEEIDDGPEEESKEQEGAPGEVEDLGDSQDAEPEKN